MLLIKVETISHFALGNTATSTYGYYLADSEEQLIAYLTRMRALPSLDRDPGEEVCYLPGVHWLAMNPDYEERAARYSIRVVPETPNFFAFEGTRHNMLRFCRSSCFEEPNEPGLLNRAVEVSWRILAQDVSPESLGVLEDLVVKVIR
jgi:hypothetical protein